MKKHTAVVEELMQVHNLAPEQEALYELYHVRMNSYK